VRRRNELAFEQVCKHESSMFARCSLIDEATHMALGRCWLDRGGSFGAHVHSFEQSFYVLSGNPILQLGDRAVQLGPGSGGVVPIGMAHGWASGGDARAEWIDMSAPRPRIGSEPPDTFFVEARPLPARPLDVRDPRVLHLFQLDDWQMDVDSLATVGTLVDQPSVSASMETALLTYSGIAVKMLVDQRLGAHLHTMFMVEYEPKGVAHPHDHPFEECYFILEGEIEAVADGAEYVLGPGDTFWTGVGCVHGFRNTSGERVRWLETTAPQPPARHAYRFTRDWSYLAEQLGARNGRFEVRSSADVVRQSAQLPTFNAKEKR
jgi:quercetin dioxygenase-like cupin family protein